ncbi:MAG: hypothetical protein P1U78_04920 [Alcanivoracaceae bacterium]|nr:hypothetical protein [Alcanivoracaceae bacterium]
MSNKNHLLTPHLEEKFLKELHRRYVDRYGHLTHKLDQYEFFTTELFEVIKQKITDEEYWYPTVDLAQSLEKKGFVRFSENRLGFFLTEQGYKFAEGSWKDKALSWLNSNQGVIAAGAFIVAIAGLFAGSC